MVSIFSRILDSQLYQAPVRIIGLQASDENLVSITFVQYYRVKFIIVFLWFNDQGAKFAQTW